MEDIEQTHHEGVTGCAGALPSPDPLRVDGVDNLPSPLHVDSVDNLPSPIPLNVSGNTPPVSDPLGVRLIVKKRSTREPTNEAGSSTDRPLKKFTFQSGYNFPGFPDEERSTGSMVRVARDALTLMH